MIAILGTTSLFLSDPSAFSVSSSVTLFNLEHPLISVIDVPLSTFHYHSSYPSWHTFNPVSVHPHPSHISNHLISLLLLLSAFPTLFFLITTHLFLFHIWTPTPPPLYLPTPTICQSPFPLSQTFWSSLFILPLWLPSSTLKLCPWISSPPPPPLFSLSSWISHGSPLQLHTCSCPSIIHWLLSLLQLLSRYFMWVTRWLY